MSLETRNMVKWMKTNSLLNDTDIKLTVARAFKHDTEQMRNERSLVVAALNFKKQYECGMELI